LRDPLESYSAEKIERDHSIALLEKRKQWANEIKSVGEKFQTVLPGLLKNEAKLNQEREDLIKRHREELLQLNRRFDAAREERAQASAERDRLVEPAERNLRTTASPKIDEFWRALDRRRRELGSGDRELGNATDGRHIVLRSTYPIFSAPL
jgi:hypothetical protein